MSFFFARLLRHFLSLLVDDAAQIRCGILRRASLVQAGRCQLAGRISSSLPPSERMGIVQAE